MKNSSIEQLNNKRSQYIKSRDEVLKKDYNFNFYNKNNGYKLLTSKRILKEFIGFDPKLNHENFQLLNIERDAIFTRSKELK